MVMMSPFLITAFLATRKKARHWRRAKSREKRRESRSDRKLPQLLRAFCGNSHTVAGEVWVAAEWYRRAIDHYLADDGGDGDLALPGEEAGVMVGHVDHVG